MNDKRIREEIEKNNLIIKNIQLSNKYRSKLPSETPEESLKKSRPIVSNNDTISFVNNTAKYDEAEIQEVINELLINFDKITGNDRATSQFIIDALNEEEKLVLYSLWDVFFSDIVMKLQKNTSKNIFISLIKKFVTENYDSVQNQNTQADIAKAIAQKVARDKIINDLLADKKKLIDTENAVQKTAYEKKIKDEADLNIAENQKYVDEQNRIKQEEAKRIQDEIDAENARIQAENARIQAENIAKQQQLINSIKTKYVTVIKGQLINAVETQLKTFEANDNNMAINVKIDKYKAKRKELDGKLNGFIPIPALDKKIATIENIDNIVKNKNFDIKLNIIKSCYGPITIARKTALVNEKLNTLIKSTEPSDLEEVYNHIKNNKLKTVVVMNPFIETDEVYKNQYEEYINSAEYGTLSDIYKIEEKIEEGENSKIQVDNNLLNKSFDDIIKETYTKPNPVIFTNDGVVDAGLRVQIADAIDNDVQKLITDIRKKYDSNKSTFKYIPNVSTSTASPNTNTTTGNGFMGYGLKTRYKSAGNNPKLNNDKYFIDLKFLNKNQLVLKYMKNSNNVNQFKPVVISDQYKSIIQDLTKTGKINENSVSKLSDTEKNNLIHLLDICNIHHDLIDDFNKNFAILKGEYEAGNDSPQIKNQLKKYILQGLQQNKLKKSIAYDLLYELSL